MFSGARIARNSAILMGQRLLLTLVSVFVVGYIGTSVGPENFGKFILSLSFASLFGFVGNLGTRTVATGDMAADRENARAVFSRFMTVKILLSLLAGLLTIAAAYALPNPSDTRYLILIAALSQTLVMIYKAPHAVFEAFEEMHYVVMVEMAARTVVIAAVLYSLWRGAGIVTVAWCYAGGNVFELLLSYYLLRRYFFPIPGPTLDRAKMWKLLRRALPFAFIGIFTILINEFDKIMLSQMASETAVGIYGAASRIHRNFYLINDSIFTAMFPAIVALYARGDAAEFRNKVSFLATVLMGVTLPLAFGTTAISDDVIALIYKGGAYADSAGVLSLLVWTIPLTALNAALYCVLYCEEKHRQMVYANFSMMLLNVVLNFVFIPRYSFTGAAAASLLTVVARLGIFWAYTGTVLIRRDFLGRTAGLLACCGVMTAVVLVLKRASFPGQLLVTIAAGMAVYALLVAALRILPVKQVLKTFLGRRGRQ
jgi:O-antigen/teichoic acid export membrane protein